MGKNLKTGITGVTVKTMVKLLVSNPQALLESHKKAVDLFLEQLPRKTKMENEKIWEVEYTLPEKKGYLFVSYHRPCEYGTCYASIKYSKLSTCQIEKKAEADFNLLYEAASKKPCFFKNKSKCIEILNTLSSGTPLMKSADRSKTQYTLKNKGKTYWFVLETIFSGGKETAALFYMSSYDRVKAMLDFKSNVSRPTENVPPRLRHANLCTKYADEVGVPFQVALAICFDEKVIELVKFKESLEQIENDSLSNDDVENLRSDDMEKIKTEIQTLKVYIPQGIHDEKLKEVATYIADCIECGKVLKTIETAK